MMIHRRRLCLRRKDLTKKLNKRANDVLEKVRELFKEAELEISGAVLDGAHNKVFKINNDVIVRFTAFRHRTSFYHNDKKLKNQKIFTLISQNCNFLY